MKKENLKVRVKSSKSKIEYKKRQLKSIFNIWSNTKAVINLGKFHSTFEEKKLSALHRGKLHSNRAFQLEDCDESSQNLKKEVKRAAMSFLLPFAFSRFSNITNRQCCKLKPFRNLHWLEKYKLSKYLDSLLYINFSCNFESFVRILLICALFCCTFTRRIKEKISQARKRIGIVKGLSNVLPRN